ncbi:MAG: hypothetical protein LBQ92_01005, partial [Propionibacteriaceae bacterium]|nr:hypothetical protein [Propionibacteriaceae bacterium]
EENKTCLGAKTAAGDCTYSGTSYAPQPEAVLESRSRTCWGLHDHEDANCVLIKEKPGTIAKAAMIGDSHMSMLRPMVQAAAKELGWSLDDHTVDTCELVFDGSEDTSSVFVQGCIDETPNIMAALAQEHYDYVFLASFSHHFGPKPDAEYQHALQLKRGLLEQIAATGAQPIIIRDTPSINDGQYENPNDCLSAKTPPECAFARDTAFMRDANADAAAELGMPVLDMNDLICPDDGSGRCPVVIGGVNIYVDLSHLTIAYVETMTPYLIQRLEPYL